MSKNNKKIKIVAAGIGSYQKRLDKCEKKVKKESDKLFQAGKNMKDVTMSRRRRMRIRLDNACEERDRMLETIKAGEELLEELKGVAQ